MAELPRDEDGRYACPCCGYFVFDSDPDGTFWICNVCWWEVEYEPLNYLDVESGPNHITLREGRKNFVEHRISKLKHLNNSRIMDRLPESVTLPRYDWVTDTIVRKAE